MDSMVLEVQKWLNSHYSQIHVEEDGITGAGTFKGLITALQLEIGVGADGDFGSGTLNACPTLQQTTDTTPSNLVYILQGSFWCKGYNPGGFDGIFGAGTTAAVKEFQADAGIEQTGIVEPYVLQGIMNTDGYKFEPSADPNDTYRHEVQLGLNKYYGSQIGLIAPNGLWERKSQTNLIKACQIEWGTTADGIWGSGTMGAAPTLSTSTSGYTNSKRILQWCLAVNGFYPGGFDGAFGQGTADAVYQFQELMCLGADGIVGQNTWAALLSSCGNTNRSATCFDTSTRLTVNTAKALRDLGYLEVGRYLTNAKTGDFDKKMTSEEIQAIRESGLKVFPIFQTYGGESSYFTKSQGMQDATDAVEAAKNLGFPKGTVIYFAVDYDVLTADIEEHIVPYFSGIHERLGNLFQVGVYGPRMVCNTLSDYNITVRSFVADMSSGFTGNIGVIMPANWAYDQFVETSAAGIAIDKCGSSNLRTSVSPDDFVIYGNPEEPTISQELEIFVDLYNVAKNYLESLSSELTASYYSVLTANKTLLAYLRSPGYNDIMWTVLNGPIDEGYIQAVKDAGISVDITALAIKDPLTGIDMEITHFAAVLGSCINYVVGINFGIDRNLDSYAGWAGDLLQMAGIVQDTLDHSGRNYFTKEDLCNFIGATADSLNGYTLYTQSSGEYVVTSDSGFSQLDLLQDIDAYNISKLFNLSETTLYAALGEYYKEGGSYTKRFSIFKENLLDEFGRDSLSAIAIDFADKSVLTAIFEGKFGDFDNNQYAGVLADAFEEKIDRLIAEYE